MQKFLLTVLFAMVALPLACASGSDGDAGSRAPEPSDCAVGQAECGEHCTDLSGDGRNCGTCGTQCAGEQVCSAGLCQHSCTEPGRTRCETSCVDLPSDPNHCGECGVVCGAGQTCEAGACAGEAGTGGTAGTGGSGIGGQGAGGQGTGGQGTGGGGPDGSEGDYYVSLDGSDDNPGTIEQPFATMQHAIDVAEPGELVYVRGGVYDIVDGARPGSGIHFHKSGASDGERIRYFAYPGELPVFEFKNLKIQPDPKYTAGFYVDGAWIHLKGFEIRNVPMNTRSNTGLSVGGGAHHDIFEQLDIHHNFGTGLFINTTTGGHQVINCDSHDNYDPYSHQGDGENADGFGVHYQKTGDVTIFRGCRAWWNSDDGWDFISQEVPVVVENSWAMGHGYINSGTGQAGNGNGFKIGSSKTGIRHIVRNNVAWGNRASGFYANHSAGGNDWLNNTSYNNGTQFNLLASSWDANGNRTDGVILTGDKAHKMRNNISFPLDNTNMQGVDSSFNSWDLGLKPSNADFLSASADGLTGPRGPDGSLPSTNFMKLSPGSALIDVGTDVGIPFAGSAPDLGAYEK